MKTGHPEVARALHWPAGSKGTCRPFGHRLDCSIALAAARGDLLLPVAAGASGTGDWLSMYSAVRPIVVAARVKASAP